MSRSVTQRLRGFASTEVVNGILGCCAALLTLWGIGWSFYRHGPVHGIAAVLIPPYGLYRGVASVWEKPRWKEDYDIRTEQIGMVITNAANSDASYQIQSRDFIHDLHTWVRGLPTAEHERLHEASQSYAQAVADYTRLYGSAIAEGAAKTHPETEPVVQARLDRFKSIGGLWKAWNRLLEDAAAINWDTPTTEQQGTVDVADETTPTTSTEFESRVRKYVDAATIKMERTIDELFSQSD
jgi:hypothetical protein